MVAISSVRGRLLAGLGISANPKLTFRPTGIFIGGARRAVGDSQRAAENLMGVARRADGLIAANLLLLSRDGVSSIPLARRSLAVTRWDV